MQSTNKSTTDSWSQFAAEVRQWSLGIRRRMTSGLLIFLQQLRVRADRLTKVFNLPSCPFQRPNQVPKNLHESAVVQFHSGANYTP